MRYRLTTLTPLLVGDGQKLAPIEYMIWKDQINVLDQYRIFRLLAKGPRLEGYLSQLRRADKLDFASWGGFAQNYASRRIPFEHASSTPVWQGAMAQDLFIPLFCSGPQGQYLPGSALKGSLRTAVAFTRWNPGVIREIANRMEGDRPPRRPGEAAEAMTLGSIHGDPMRAVGAGDSDPVSPSSFRVYLVRVASLAERGGKLELAWKQAPRGYAPANRPNDSTPVFAEMAAPGTVFSGLWRSISRGQQKNDRQSHERFFQAANEHAGKLLEAHMDYATKAGLAQVKSSLEAVQSRLAGLNGRKDACLLNLGWAGGFLGKSAFIDTANEDYRKLLRRLPYYERAIRSGLPFPKTRRVIFEQGQPSTLAGWAVLEVA
jgi:CRISPR-associated protein Csm5